MGKVYDAIDEKLATWIDKQHLFFVATAPLSGEGLVNCSPKGLDAFRILDTAIWRLRQEIEPDPKNYTLIHNKRGRGYSLTTRW